ncbi:Dihydropteroate synthase [hydrothermal vent metagenome]|uniref:dihydropteroate synthase n=1 Tax=hydrothermal vent metagenome TaxID=652676 RepID=A0A3B1BFB4_9ZZZZ
MGILNITPDSFSDGGKFFDNPSRAVKQAGVMIKQGADIIDVGGESSRPGAEPVGAEEEAGRVIPVIRGIVKQYPKTLVSIDSYKPEVVKKALDEGAAMINDISGLRDPEMVKLAADYKAPVVIMHMKGTPQTMQKRPAYKDVVDDIVRFFKERIKLCRANGISKIILDPGIGFGKTGKHNLSILRRLDEITRLGYPTLIGVSRKSFIGKALGELVDDRESATIAVNAIAVNKGASIIRVHDVEKNVQAVRIADLIAKH